MTISTTESRKSYTGNGSTAAFSFPYKFLADGDLKVYVDNVLKTLTTDYTVSGAGSESGGTVTFVTAPASLTSVVFYRDMAITQEVDYITGDAFPAETHEEALDRLTMIDQQQEDQIDRAVKLQLGDETSSMELPVKATRATKMLGFDADGDPIMSASTVDEIDASVSAALGSGVLATSYQFTGTGSQVAFTITGGVTDILNSSAIIVDIDGVTQHTDTYTVSGKVVTFSVAPPLNGDIQVRYNAYLGDATDAASATYNQGGTGASSRTVENKLQESVSVKDFGAVGDYLLPGGTSVNPSPTDDTVAIQAAIDSIGLGDDSYSRGGSIFFPKGVYHITASLYCDDSYTRLTLVGEKGAEIRLDSSVSSQVLHLQGNISTASNYLKFVTIDGLSFRGYDCLKTEWTEHLVIKNSTFVATNKCISMSEVASSSDIKPKITNNLFTGASYGIYTGETRVADADISNNIFKDISGIAIRLGYLDGGLVEGNKIFNELSSATPNVGILAYKPIWVRFINNDIFEVNGLGMNLGSPRHCTVQSNTFVEVGKSSNDASLLINYYGSVACLNMTINDNKFSNCYGNAIKITKAVEAGKLINNQINGVAYGTAAAIDGIHISGANGWSLLDNYSDGDSTGRYWLYLNSSDIVLRENTHSSFINGDLYNNASSSNIKMLPGGEDISMTDGTLNLLTDTDVIFSGTLTASRYVNMPPANWFSHKMFTFIKTDSSPYSMILDPVVSQTIDGSLTKNVNVQYQAVVVYSDGTQWITE